MFRNQFSMGSELIYNQMFLITGTFSLSRLPDIPCSFARFKVRTGNPGSIFLGFGMNTGTINYLPFEMEAGYDSGWFSIGNLNNFYQGNSSGSSYFAAWIQK